MCENVQIFMYVIGAKVHPSPGGQAYVKGSAGFPTSNQQGDFLMP